MESMEGKIAASEVNQTQDPTTYDRIVQFCYAVYRDNEKALLELLRNGYDVNARIALDNRFMELSPKIEGLTALQFACQNSSTKSVEVLLENGADFIMKSPLGLTALHSAVEDRSTSDWNAFDRIFNRDCVAPRILSAHVKNNVTTNPVNNHGLSHFHIACMFSQVEAVKLFLGSGVQINEAIHNDSPILPGYTALHIAARYGSLKVLKMLLNCGADVQARTRDGRVPLHLIFARLEELSFRAIDPNPPEESLILIAKVLNDTSTIASILIQETLKPGTLTNELCIACAKKSSASVNEVLYKGVDINAKTGFGFTSLHYAALMDFDVTKLLLEHGADIFLQNDDGKTPLDVCTWKYGFYTISLLPCVQQFEKHIRQDGHSWRIALALPHIAILEELLADDDVAQEINTPCIAPESPIWPGTTVLHLAIKFARNYPHEHMSPRPIPKSSSDIVQVLLSHEASITQQDAQGQTPVHLAFYQKKTGILKILLNPDCRPSGLEHFTSREHPVDENGLSHFHIACAMGCRTSILVLLITGASPNEPITSDVAASLNPKMPEILLRAGSTSMHIAVKFKEINTIKTLANLDANISVKDADGLTPMDLVALDPDFDKLELLELTFHLVGKNCFVDTNSVEPNEQVCHFESLGAAVNPVIFYAKYGSCVKPDTSEITRFLEIQNANSEKGLRATKMALNCLGVIKEFMSKSLNPNTMAASYMKSLKWIFKKNIDYGLSNYECIKIYAESTLSNCKAFIVMDEESQITTLHLACAINRGDWVEELLAKSSVDVNCRLSTDSPFFPGSTPLHLAIKCCEKKTLDDYADGIVKMMLKHGADPTIQDVNGETPLHLSDRYRLTAITNLLLRDERIAEKNLTSKFGRSHFHIACSRGLPEIVEKFLQLGADPNELNHQWDNEVWQEPQTDDIPSFFAFTPLQVARNLGVITVLLKYGADVEIKDYRGWTALHYAAKIGRKADVIKMLIRDGGANVNSLSVLHLTPLDLIVTERMESDEDRSRIRTLLKHGALVNHKNFEASSTFARALESDDNVELLHTLIKYGKDVNGLNEQKRTAMHELFIEDYNYLDTSEEYITIIEKLWEKGVDIDSQDYLEQTPLHAAVQNDLDDGIIALLKCGADINLVDCEGRTPFSVLMNDAGVDSDDDESIPFSEQEGMVPTFWRHIQKMKAFNMPVSRQNMILEAVIKDSKSSDHHIQEIKNSAELERMRGIVLEENFTLHDVMFADSHKLAALMGNVQFKTLLSSKNFHKKFSELGCILKLKFRIGHRRKLIDLATKSLYFLSKMRLPILCIEIIVTNLSNDDLRTLANTLGEYSPLV